MVSTYGVREETSSRRASTTPARVAGAVLALAVTIIHVIDEGGFPGQVDPAYVGVGYYLLEAAGVVVAAALLARREGIVNRLGWWLAAGVGLGPFLGYLLSRGPGLPNYSDDKGAWLEPLGVLSLVVEAALIVLAFTALRTAAPAATQTER
jgi:hypothetical protein